MQLPTILHAPLSTRKLRPFREVAPHLIQCLIFHLAAPFMVAECLSGLKMPSYWQKTIEAPFKSSVTSDALSATTACMKAVLEMGLENFLLRHRPFHYSNSSFISTDALHRTTEASHKTARPDQAWPNNTWASFSYIEVPPASLLPPFSYSCSTLSALMPRCPKLDVPPSKSPSRHWFFRQWGRRRSLGSLINTRSRQTLWSYCLILGFLCLQPPAQRQERFVGYSASIRECPQEILRVAHGPSMSPAWFQ